MDGVLRLLVDFIIKSMHLYNSMLVYRPAQDPQCIKQKGRVEALCDFLRELGYPLTISQGRVWHNSSTYHSEGYGCIMFTKSVEELEKIGILSDNHFENGIYWFMEGNSKLIQYRKKGNL